ncbi:MAG: exodeoxyribonuclease VII large subunit [Syntrophomonadaceae bacterium]|nr:exodeoxyribonuclease VII large subunit [Syntrophomonadaceae bacterium]
MERKRVLSVSELTGHIKTVLEQERLLAGVWVRGEISGYKLYRQSGHAYFSLKDEGAVISCVMFRSRVRHLRFLPEDGMKVVARGYISVFEKNGRYQLYIEEMEPDGLGALFLQLRQLRDRLDREGLFALERKKTLPVFARRVGVVTSQDGAAFRDIVKVIRQRHPGAEVVIAHSAVQGAAAPAEISAAIRALNEYGQVDVLIVGRGGGSFEDLWAFNTEEVVRAVYESRIPVISAVGHEVDYSLCDLVADARAATPTQAAQMAVPDIEALGYQSMVLKERLQNAVSRNISRRWQELDQVRDRKVWSQPETLTRQRDEWLSFLRDRLVKSCLKRLDEQSYRLNSLARHLDALGPHQVLRRGYALVRKLEAGDLVNDVEKVRIEEELEIILKRGTMRVRVEAKEPEKNGKHDI